MSLNVVMAPSVAPIGSKLTINENGQYDVTDYAVAEVNVSGGGGGETWNTVFEGNVTTVNVSQDFAEAKLTNLASLSGDSIKVTFNGTEYILPKGAEGYGAENQGIDFSEYPLYIVHVASPCVLCTPEAGTYSLKIEEPQSGGGSDFSTAEVTVNANRQFEFYAPLINDEHGYLGSYNNINPNESVTLTVGLYKGKALTQFITDGVVSVSGNAQLNDDQILITGDCTITIS